MIKITKKKKNVIAGVVMIFIVLLYLYSYIYCFINQEKTYMFKNEINNISKYITSVKEENDKKEKEIEEAKAEAKAKEEEEAMKAAILNMANNNVGTIIDKNLKESLQDTTINNTNTSVSYYSTDTVATYSDAVAEEQTQSYTVDYVMYEVVEAETHGAGKEAKKRIAHVIMNRVYDGRFPNSISGVCYQSNQFAMRGDVESSTIEAVNEAMNEGDTTGGALWFCTCGGCWADCNASYIFTDEVGHNFYK